MLILDLKTVPDPAAGKRLLALEQFSDAEALLAMRTLRVAGQGHAEVPPHLCRVVAATLVHVEADHCSVQSFEACVDEAAALLALDAAIAAIAQPVFVWDGRHGARALLAARALAWHLPLPQLLADDGPRCLSQQHALGTVPLSELAAVHGLPHRLGLLVDDIEPCAKAGAARLRDGCAADALMTALLHLALSVASGRISAALAAAHRAQIADWLQAQSAAHWQSFRQQWNKA